MKKLLKRSFIILMIALLLFTGKTAKDLNNEIQAQQTTIQTQQQQIEHMQKVIDYQDVKLKINNNRIQYQEMQLKDLHSQEVHKQVQAEPKVVSVDDVRKELSEANNGLTLHTNETIWASVIGGIAVIKEFVVGKLHMDR